MPDFNYLYPHLGGMHNEGVNFVLHRLTVTEANPVTQNAILNHTAEFMCLVTCCVEGVDKFEAIPRSSKLFSNVRIVEFSDFLYALHEKMKAHTFDDWTAQATISSESSALLKILVSTEDETDTSNMLSLDTYPPFYLINSLAQRVARNPGSDNERRVLGTVTSVARESMDFALRVQMDPAKKGRTIRSIAERIDYAEKEPVEPAAQSAPPGALPKKGFQWSWRADLEGTLSGFVSGAIGGIPGGFAGAGIGGALGALGGGISNSLTKSLPAFR